MQPKLTILGVDPGSSCTGWGLLWGEGNSIRYVASGAIKLPKAAARIDKLRLIHVGVADRLVIVHLKGEERHIIQ